MKSESRRFRAVDILFILMMILPLVFCIVLKVLTKPLSEGIDISGALVYFTIKMPVQDLPVTESQVNSLMVLISILGLCLYLTHGINKGPLKARHHIAEFLVEKADGVFFL